MKLHLLQKLIDDFLLKRLHPNDTSWYFPHSIVDHFHKQWKAGNDLDLKEKYNQSLRSDISQRWWKKDHYRPKEIMLQLIDTDAELALIAFKDLANDSASLDGRISRFQFYTEDLLQMLRQKDSRISETYHHQDAHIMSLYLAGLFPDKYALYPGLEVFKNYCMAVGSPEVPVIDDLVRYMKVASIVFTFIQKNENFSILSNIRRSELHRIAFIPYQTSYEFISYVGGNTEFSGS
ncbi:MAG: hypothetical protein ABIQ11_09130 [Saprospiraceae bacterium]